MNLQAKLWLLILSSSITGIILLFGIAAIIGALFNQGYTHESLNMLGNELTLEVENADVDLDRVELIFREFSEEHSEFKLYWFSEDGELRYASDGRKNAFHFDELMNHFLNMPGNLWEVDKEITLLFDWEQNGTRNYLMMNLPNHVMQGSQIYFYVQDNNQFLLLVIPVILFLATPFIFALFFFSKLNRRLKRLNRAMKDFNAQGSKIVLNDQSQDEIGQLTRNFNEMANRIRRQVDEIQEIDAKRKSLIANISHDLRTPLTMIIGYAETLNSGIVQGEDDRKKHTEIILRRSKYMDQLLQKLLEVAQLNTYKSRIHFNQQDLSEFLRRIAADYFPVLESKNTKFDVQLPEELINIRFDSQLVERAVRNLIENAIQYGGDGNYLGLFLKEDAKFVHIIVSDCGQGIPEEKQKHIFERFYRGAEGRVGEGLGLGLSIVQEVAAVHEGSVTMESIPYERTTFTLAIPKE